MSLVSVGCVTLYTTFFCFIMQYVYKDKRIFVVDEINQKRCWKGTFLIFKINMNNNESINCDILHIIVNFVQKNINNAKKTCDTK